MDAIKRAVARIIIKITWKIFNAAAKQLNNKMTFTPLATNTVKITPMSAAEERRVVEAIKRLEKAKRNTKVGEYPPKRV